MAERLPTRARRETVSRQRFSPSATPPHRNLKRVLVAVAGVATMLLAASPAQASEAISSFTVDTSTTQAGGHPDLTTSMTLDSPAAPEVAKDVAVRMPEGVFGNPQAIRQCTTVDFAQQECPPTSQAGVVTIHANYGGNTNNLLGSAPIFDMVPASSDETARFAFVVPGVNIPISVPVTVRTGSDYGLTFSVTGITQIIPLAGVDFTVWGVPADHSHDTERFLIGSPSHPAGCPGDPTALCASQFGSAPNLAGIPPQPLTDNPTTCTGQPLTVSAEVRTYQDPGNPSGAQATYPPSTGCELETFNPVLNMSLTSTEADSPAGLDVTLKAPQFESHAASPSEIRSTTIALPESLSINPDAADGQRACTDAQANFGSDGPAHCPDNAKIGNFDVETPALTGPLTGAIFFGEPRPNDQYRLFLISDGFGIHSKLVGSVLPDPQTGRLTMTLRDLPQVPFEALNVHLFASDRGLVATPTQCRVYNVDSVFVPWNASLAPQHSAPILSIDSGPSGSSCPGPIRPFHPNLVAGASNPVAGAFSSFTLRLDRNDGDQFLGDLNFRMPPGFTGRLRGITYCPDAAIEQAANDLGRTELATPSCPASSQIGTTNVAAGPGTHPFHAVGRMYLAGPFKGAPLSLAAVTPALAGPYDYGTVVVRVALHVDTSTAQVTAVSDTVPRIIGGVPIRMRSIQVNIDKPNFTINPTNCSPFSIDSQGIGDQGTVADFSSYFHAVNCAALHFKPAMTLRQLGGRKATGRSKDPALQFDLRTRPGDANIKSLTVTLPKAFAIDQRHLGNICSKAQLAAEHCAGRQPIGTATTVTPLLDQPLKGPAYAVSGFGKLPHVVFILGGQVTIMPEAESSSVKGRLTTTVPVVPDAPIGHFRLNLLGGKQGYLTNTRDLCSHQPISRVSFVGQNGSTYDQRLPMKVACGDAGKHHQRDGRGGR